MQRNVGHIKACGKSPTDFKSHPECLVKVSEHSSPQIEKNSLLAETS